MPLTDTSALRADLIARRLEVTGLLNGPQQTDVDGAGDDVDTVIAVESRELTYARRLQLARELREIDVALARINSGAYGDCIDCGGGIPLARLKAMPAADRCVGCQTAYEHEQPAGRERDERWPSPDDDDA
jgi:DnaK suppressor protein